MKSPDWGSVQYIMKSVQEFKGGIQLYFPFFYMKEKCILMEQNIFINS